MLWVNVESVLTRSVLSVDSIVVKFSIASVLVATSELIEFLSFVSSAFRSFVSFAKFALITSSALVLASFSFVILSDNRLSFVNLVCASEAIESSIESSFVFLASASLSIFACSFLSAASLTPTSICRSFAYSEMLFDKSFRNPIILFISS